MFMISAHNLNMDSDEEIKFPLLADYLKRSRARRKWWAEWDTNFDDEEVDEADDEATPPMGKRIR